MKNNTINNSAQMQTSTPIRSTLFDSILGTEAQAVIDADIHKHANRVGLILKICYSRNLDAIRESFTSEISRLVQMTANSIDNELSSTVEDTKSEV